MILLRWSCLLCCSLATASPARAQRFGFRHEMFPAVADATREIALGDLDGDGDLDAFSGNEGSDGLFLNDGLAAFTAAGATNLPAVADETYAVGLGDVDGDGDLDVFVGNDGQNRLYLNNGLGSLTDVTVAQLPPLDDDTRDLALGDLDGDGDLDAFVANYASENRLYSNGGTGTFTDVSATNLLLPGPYDCATAVALGDLDGDGDLDALLGGGCGRLLWNNGAGVLAFSYATIFPCQWDYTVAVEFGDLDADGDLDVFLGNGVASPPFGPEQDRLFLNGGGGAFADVTATNLPVLLALTTSIASGDVEGDGDLDLLVGNDGQSRLWLNGGSGAFVDATAGNLPPLLAPTESVAFGDLDGDGDPDLLLGNDGEATRLYLNGGGVLVDATPPGDLPSVLDSTTSVALGDVDGDGDLDAFVGNGGSSLPVGSEQARLYVNGGDGLFADVTTTNLPASLDRTRGVAFGDVDADGDLDAFVGNASPGPSRLYLNGGTGTFTDATATQLPALAGETFAVAFGDVDGDGDLDAILGNWGQSRLYLNAGAGAFADATGTNLPSLSAATRAVALGDLDGDGDLDAFLSAGGQQNRLYVNAGAGLFADATATNLPAWFSWTFAIALGDVDGDGDLDALQGDYLTQNRLYLNGGTGVFADATATNLPALVAWTTAVALGDLDQDGDLDAFLGLSGIPPDGQNRLYLNGGGGVFADATATDLPRLIGNTRAIVLGDLDGDGDLDAFAGVDGQDRIYVNRTRHLEWRSIPRAGRPLVLDLRGPASGTWLLAASAAPSSIPLPPVGTLHLLPATLFVVSGGGLDPQGQASVSFVVPANPALVGASLYWQALVGPPLRFTNLEVTTVTNL